MRKHMQLSIVCLKIGEHDSRATAVVSRTAATATSAAVGAEMRVVVVAATASGFEATARVEAAEAESPAPLRRCRRRCLLAAAMSANGTAAVATGTLARAEKRAGRWRRPPAVATGQERRRGAIAIHQPQGPNS